MLKLLVFHLVKAEQLNSGTQNVVTVPTALAGNLLEMQFLEPLYRPTESQTLGVESNLFQHALQVILIHH